MAGKDVVEAFLAGWSGSRAGLEASFRRWLDAAVVWENVGLTRTTDIGQALALIDTFLPGLDHIDVEILALAEVGDHILTERIDHLRNADGDLLASIRVMGNFRVDEGRICDWRDYFDTAPFAGTSKS